MKRLSVRSVQREDSESQGGGRRAPRQLMLLDAVFGSRALPTGEGRSHEPPDTHSAVGVIQHQKIRPVKECSRCPRDGCAGSAA